MEDNCISCLYSLDDEITILIQDLQGVKNDCTRCDHPNSPYYKELVNDSISCRLYLNAQEHFKMKDRQENIENIKNKINGR